MAWEWLRYPAVRRGKPGNLCARIMTRSSSEPGIAGLSAALHLAERGLKPLVLEADTRFVGGRLAGGEVGGGEWLEVQAGTRRARHLVAVPEPAGQCWPGINLRPVFVPAQEERWYYRDAGGVRSTSVGSAIRHSFIPAPSIIYNYSCVPVS